MRKPRDYRAEYEARIKRGISRGASRSQARGHAHTASRSKVAYDPSLEAALTSFRQTHNLTKSAKQHHKSAERLRQYARQSRVVRKVGRQWIFLKDVRIRETPFYTKGEFKWVSVRGFAAASKARLYMADTERFFRTNNLAFLDKWKGEGVEDADGHWVPFETRPNILYRLNATEKEPFEQIYRIVI